MTPSEAVRIFYGQISLKKALPFAITLPASQETLSDEEKKEIEMSWNDYKNGDFTELKSAEDIDSHFNKLSS
jgi:antitoxin component of RelBE/YafQ-DinJ toxin-antitoxin module